MKYNSLIYLTEQLKKLKEISNANTYTVDKYISYITSVIGNFNINPGSINKKLEGNYYDLSFNAYLESNDYRLYPMMCKAFTPFYNINVKLKSGYSEMRVKKNINGLLIFIFYSDLTDNKEHGLYILEKNTIDPNQEVHISFYDYNTYRSLSCEYGIELEKLKSYSSLNLYELGILPDKETSVSISKLGLINEDELQCNNIGDINGLITYRILNKLSFNGFINRINNSLSTSKHI